MPLAPLPDEPEANEGDEDMEQDDQTNSVAPDSASRAVSEPVTVPPEREELTPAPPKPHPLSMSLVPGSPSPPPEVDETTLNTDLTQLDPAVDDESGALGDVTTSLQVPPELSGDINDLDLSQLGPDGEPFESTGDLAQLQATDSLLGGEVMDESSDPFNSTQIPQ